MRRPLGAAGSADPTAADGRRSPAPASSAQVSDIVTVTADADDNVGVVGVQFFVDGVATGRGRHHSALRARWDTRTVAERRAHPDGPRPRRGRQHDRLGAGVAVNVANTNSFQNEILATGFNLPTTIEFLPDGRMLVVELAGKIKVLPPPVHDAGPDAVPAAHQHRLGRRAAGHLRHRARSRTSRPTTSTTSSTRSARRTATGCRGSPPTPRSPGRSPGSEFGPLPGPAERQRRAPRRRDHVRQRRQALLHHRRALRCRRRAGPHQPARQDPPDQPRRHRSRPTTRSTTAPARTVDSIWALGLRNPYRAYYDAPTGRMYIGDVGGNDYSTAKEEVDLGAPGANYGWPDYRGHLPGAVHQPAVLVPAQRARLRDHRRLRLPRHAVPGVVPGQLLLRRLHPELDPPADVRRQRQRHRRLQLRAGRRLASTARTATSCT